MDNYVCHFKFAESIESAERKLCPLHWSAERLESADGKLCPPLKIHREDHVCRAQFQHLFLQSDSWDFGYISAGPKPDFILVV
jgi:hypothetical protein